jgi:hypothetical protein
VPTESEETTAVAKPGASGLLAIKAISIEGP